MFITFALHSDSGKLDLRLYPTSCWVRKGSKLSDNISSTFQSENVSLTQLDGDMIGQASLQARYQHKKKVLLITLNKIKFYTEDQGSMSGRKV
jgi:hypothetical protein